MIVLQEGGADPSKQVADPYANEPKRHRALIVRSPKPFNAETPKDALGSGPTTPNELFYVRNHLPVPHVEPGAYSVRALQHFSSTLFSCTCWHACALCIQLQVLSYADINVSIWLMPLPLPLTVLHHTQACYGNFLA